MLTIKKSERNEQVGVEEEYPWFFESPYSPPSESQQLVYKRGIVISSWLNVFYFLVVLRDFSPPPPSHNYGFVTRKV